MPDPQPPLPQPDALTAPFWEACRRGALEVSACADCGHRFLPPGPCCPRCWSPRLATQRSLRARARLQLCRLSADLPPGNAGPLRGRPRRARRGPATDLEHRRMRAGGSCRRHAGRGPLRSGGRLHAAALRAGERRGRELVTIRFECEGARGDPDDRPPEGAQRARLRDERRAGGCLDALPRRRRSARRDPDGRGRAGLLRRRRSPRRRRFLQEAHVGAAPAALGAGARPRRHHEEPRDRQAHHRGRERSTAWPGGSRSPSPATCASPPRTRPSACRRSPAASSRGPAEPSAFPA